jgi:putative membrane protein
MVLWHRRLPWREREALPPAKITHNALEDIGVADDLSQEEMTAATIGNHFGYGTATGALYGLITQSTSIPPVHAGIAFGLTVWATSYLGWLPALGWHRSAMGEPRPRNAMMIAAHIVYGASLGLLTDILSRRAPGQARELPHEVMATKAFEESSSLVHE